MLTDAQTPFLGTPLVPLKLKHARYLTVVKRKVGLAVFFVKQYSFSTVWKAGWKQVDNNFSTRRKLWTPR